MKRTHKIAIMGLSGLTVAVGTLAGPLVYSASAEPVASAEAEASIAGVDLSAELEVNRDNSNENTNTASASLDAGLDLPGGLLGL